MNGPAITAKNASTPPHTYLLINSRTELPPRAVLRWDIGKFTPNLGLAPKCDMKHCMTNSKHRHIDAKRRVLWPSKYAKMRFRLGLRPGHLLGSWWRSQSPWRLGRGHARHSAPLGTLFGGGASPLNILVYNRPWWHHRCLHGWWRGTVAGMCDPCLSALKLFVYHARRYTSALLYLLHVSVYEIAIVGAQLAPSFDHT